ncbi:MAG: hypothetical protein B6I20_08350 [Bacteroidetes bacterium 4572_117]|nr:MAG: hypothetical protein B6I20_08350 [Bacteroidetes bacterium 4572_117]
MRNKNIIKLVSLALIVAMVVFAGCQKQEVIKIIGFIQGHAFDGNTNAPLDNVKITWSVAGKKDSTVVSAADGYLISNLPSGDYSLWCSKENYTTILTDIRIGEEFTITETVRGGANKEQIVTYNPNLYPLNAGFSGRVYKNEDGVDIPVEGAKVQLDYNSQTEDDEENYRFIPNLYEAVTDANGYYSFTNIPATRVYIRFLDFTDTNGETYGNHTNYTKYLQSGNNYANGNTILTRVVDGIHLTETNAWSSTGVGTDDFVVTSNIFLTFNKNVDQGNTKSRGYVYLQNAGIDIAAEVTFLDNEININPEESLNPNTTYEVAYMVYALQGYDVTTSSFSFTTADDATIPNKIENFQISSEIMGVDWKADYNTTSIVFSFNKIDDAERYEVYAKDDNNNHEYSRLIETVNVDQVDGLFHIFVPINQKFDYYNSDIYQTPFSHGTTVSFKIRAVNSAGKGEFSDVVDIKDELPFTNADLNISNTQSQSANNIANTEPIEITMQFSVSNSRYADKSVTPIVRLFNGATEITPFNSEVTWVNHQNGTIVFTVPAGEDYSGMELRLYNVTDSSGNTMDPSDYEAKILY